MHDSDTLSPDELAAELGLTTSQTILRRIRSGDLPARKTGRGYRIERREVDRLKRRLNQKKSSPSYRETNRDRREKIRDRFAVAGIESSS